MSLLLALLVALLPPCATDDGSGSLCGWDASAQGNGTGSDFVVIGSLIITTEGVSP